MTILTIEWTVLNFLDTRHSRSLLQ